MTFASVSRILDHLTSGRRPWGLLVALCLALYIPGIVSIPVVDRDEARYAQASRQMLETHDFLTIHFQQEARNKKPVGIYWLQSTAVAAFSNAASTEIWPYRLVSATGAMASVLLLFAYGARIYDRRTALLAAAISASTLDQIFEAHVATTDACLGAAAVAAQGALAALYLAARRGERPRAIDALVFWLAQAVAALLKGPIIPLLSIATILALLVFDRRAVWLRGLRAYWGLPLLLILVLPWYILIERATGGAFLREALGHDLAGKIAGAQESHGAFPGYYLLLTPLSFWPGSVLLGLGGLWAWRNRRLHGTRFLLSWILPFWIALELVPTKLPHYALPLYPAVALLCARATIAHAEEGFLPRPGWWVRFPAILWMIAIVLYGFGFLVASVLLDGAFFARLAGVVTAAIACALVRELWRTRPVGAATTMQALPVMAALFVIIPGLAGVAPGLPELWLSRSTAALVTSARAAGEPLAVIGYAEPSVVFMTGTKTILISAEDAEAYLRAHPKGLVLVEERGDAAWRHALDDTSLREHGLGVVTGLNYSDGHWMRLILYRTEPAA